MESLRARKRPVFRATPVAFTLAWSICFAAAPEQQSQRQKTVKGVMQKHPGGPLRDVEVGVRRVPVGVPSVPADQAELDDRELVLGVEIDGRSMAYPVRYLALFEVVDGFLSGLEALRSTLNVKPRARRT